VSVRLLSALLISVALIGCDSGGGNSGASLNGDLSWRVEGEDGLTVTISRTQIEGSSSFSFSTVTTATISDGSASGDLEDGDFDGYQLQASPNGGDRSADLTLQLRSDGEVLKESSEPQSDIAVWLVEAGDVPDRGDLNF